MNERVKEFNNSLVWQHLTERLSSPRQIGDAWVWPVTLLSKFVVRDAKYPAALVEGQVSARISSDGHTGDFRVTLFNEEGFLPDILECQGYQDDEAYRLVVDDNISFGVEDHQDHLIARHVREKLKRSFKRSPQADNLTIYGKTLASELNAEGQIGFLYREDEEADWENAFVVGLDVHQVEFLVPGRCTIYVKHRLGKTPVVTVHH